MPFFVTCPECCQRVACFESVTPYVIYCPTCSAAVVAPVVVPAPRQLLTPHGPEVVPEESAPPDTSLALLVLATGVVAVVIALLVVL